MQNTLTRLDTFVDLIDFSKGIANPAIIGALQNVSKVVRGADEVVSFANGFADHVLNSKTTQTSILFKDGVPKDKESIVSLVVDLLLSFALFYIGKKKFSKGQLTEADPTSDNNVESFNRRGYSVASKAITAEESDEDLASALVSNITDIVEKGNYDAFDDAITALQYQLMNNFKL